MKIIQFIFIFLLFMNFSHANLPLPQVVPNGGVIEAMRGMSSLENDRLRTKILKQRLAKVRERQAVAQAKHNEIYAQQSLAQSIDKTIYNCLEYSAAGHSCYWRHPTLGNRLTVTPLRNVIYNGNKNCRNYRVFIQTKNEKAQVTNLACRINGGRWVRIDDK